MATDALCSDAWPGKLRIAGIHAFAAVGLLLLTGFLPGANAQDELRNHLLGISNCPPWTPQSNEICHHSVEKVVNALAPRVNADPGSIHLLLNEGASAPALKRKATELSNQLGSKDRLIIYLNLPLALAEEAETTDVTGYVLELWANEKPVSTHEAINGGTWVSAPAFAAMIHMIPAAEVILILDTNNPHALNLRLLDQHAVDLKERPEALVSSAGAGQAANYSADRTISLFAKHLAVALGETEGSLQDVIMAAAGGTRQAAIPICASLLENNAKAEGEPEECKQVPEIHDPDGLLNHTLLLPLEDPETE